VSFVLDASLTLAWCFKDEATQHTNRVLRALQKSRAVVPSIWFYEVSNSIVTNLRSGRTTDAAVKEFVDVLKELPIDVQPTPLHASTSAAAIREVALSEKLSTYDASYIVLALELGFPLATLDGSGKRLGMKQAAQRRGLTLFQVQET
jgi:predicted nucleic acid-binding protein